ncbi:hypothetical protein FVE85_1806 [Porphyridium purpureum]|uniref:PH domain-containing protein n=1 Tax=Porphyridium purpureum TaxID=35688 RepID=A0A5J4YVX2_PORPP|nr:hypothetical protein FVE85_1806 [Porphyridium purpureum]|eukprot:POR5977..scf209_3
METEFDLTMAEQMLAELQESIGGANDWQDKENNTPHLTPAKDAPTKGAPAFADLEPSAESMEFKPLFQGDREHAKDHMAESHDIPVRFTQQPGAEQAMRDIAHCSGVIAAKVNSGEELQNTCGRGDLFIRQKFFTTMWKKRFATVVDHAYFGPVLFLFKYDKKNHIVAKTSQMIVLQESDSKLADDVRGSDGVYRCQFTLKTGKRKYVFSTSDALGREYWIELLRSYA